MYNMKMTPNEMPSANEQRVELQGKEEARQVQQYSSSTVSVHSRSGCRFVYLEALHTSTATVQWVVGGPITPPSRRQKAVHTAFQYRRITFDIIVHDSMIVWVCCLPAQVVAM